MGSRWKREAGRELTHHLGPAVRKPRKGVRGTPHGMPASPCNQHWYPYHPCGRVMAPGPVMSVMDLTSVVELELEAGRTCSRFRAYKLEE